MKHELHFVVEKETKGAVRYKEVDGQGNDAFAPVIGTLYVRKASMNGSIKQKLKLTVEEE